MERASSPLISPPTERLPSGRHGLTPESIAESQRGRLLYAIVEVVAEKGYGATTVADIVAHAGVSRRTFYEQFPSKEQGFIAAYDTGVEVVLGRLRGAQEAEPEAGWRERVRIEMESYMALLAEQPSFARALHAEVFGAGALALERRAQIFGIFADRARGAYELARATEGPRPELPAALFAFQVGGIDELIRECLRTRGAADLPRIAGAAVASTIALFGG
jgi:AcrR family transcriptional regulator